jgi:hypothetical protein
MLKELFDLVKNNATESVVNNPAVPNEMNDEVVAEATDTVASGLRNMVAGGGLQSIISMFTGGGGQQPSNSSLLNNPIVSMMIGHFVGKLTNKFNMNSGTANQVASGLIPQVLTSLVNKANDSNDGSFSLDGLLNSITGGQLSQQQQSNGINLQDIIGQLGGGQQNGGGMSDILAQLTQGAQQQQQKNGGGGLMDLIKGFMK